MDDFISNAMVNSPKRCMFQLLGKKKWRKIRRLIKTSKGYDLCQERDASNLNCLALALGNNAPIDVIQDMISIDPSLAKSKDMFGASVLHIACLNGTSYELILLILGQYGELVRDLDFDKRAPLHHAVEYACQSGDESYSYMDVIEAICMRAPEMVHLSDKDGDTPIDLVQLIKLDTNEKSREYARLHRIYTFLRKTSVEVFRQQKKRWELEGYIEKLQLEDHNKTKSTESSTFSKEDFLLSSTSACSAVSSLGNGGSTTESLNSLERKKAAKRSIRDI